MALPENIMQEIHVLALFNPASSLEGIKVHHSAEPSAIAATKRLFDKNLLTLPDGGYLTTEGQIVVGHLDSLLTVLNNSETAAA